MSTFSSIRTLTLSIILTAGRLASPAAEFPQVTTSIGLGEGLTKPNVTAVCQDEFGTVWIGTEDGLFNYDGVQMTAYRPILGDTTSLYSNNIVSLAADLRGHLYVVNKSALSLYDFRTGHFRTLRPGGFNVLHAGGNELFAATRDSVFRIVDHHLQAYCALRTEHGRITALTWYGGHLMVGTVEGLYRADAAGHVSEVIHGIHVFSFYCDTRGNLWICTRNDGALCLSPDGQRRRFGHGLADAVAISDNYVKAVCEDMYGNYWIGTGSSLDIYDVPSDQVVRRDYDMVNALFSDTQHSLWVCSRHGIDIYNLPRDIYTFYSSQFGNPTLNDFALDPAHDALYVGTTDRGLLRLDLLQGVCQRVGGVPVNRASSLAIDSLGDCLWMGMHFHGIARIGLTDGRVRIYLGVGNVLRVAPVDESSLLFAANDGVYRLDCATGSRSAVCSDPLVAGKFPICFLTDCDGYCWISTHEGLFRVSPDGSGVQSYMQDPKAFGSGSVSVIFQDSRGTLWFGTTGNGLFAYDAATDSFTAYNDANSNLCDNYIRGIGESRNGTLLVTTSSGFSSLIDKSVGFRNYTLSDGFPLANMLSRVVVTDDDRLWLASNYEVMSFLHGRLNVSDPPHAIYFRSAEVDGRERVSLLYSDSFEVPGGGSVLRLATTSPDFLSTVSAEYQLRELSDAWIPMEVGQDIVYSGLRHGTYHLTVRCRNPYSGEVSCSDSLTIRVLPRWYQTVWARIGYVLLALLLLSVVAQAWWSRVRMRQNEQVTESKLQFFTYISHEVRTPVTLIKSQVDALLEKGNVPPHIYNKVTGINRNLTRISGLLNELLDFRKLESHITAVSLREGDITELLERVAVVYREFAINSGTEFVYEVERGAETRVWYDSEQIEKVLYNLLSNAFKNTPRDGRVSLLVGGTEREVVIRVSDTGVGIPEKYVKDIFSPFFQVKGGNATGSAGGTGLGLTITKGIVEAHGGRIACRSKEGTGTTFTITLLRGDSHIPSELKAEASGEVPMEPPVEELPDEQFIEQVAASQEGEAHTILIVEDNTELRDMLATLFAPIYKVVTACDGREAWEKMQHDVPDLVLSDLMMPEMDGNELCVKVKSSILTSHVPFVMLTAKVSEESMLESIKYGADDYISKPFNAKVLISKCNNLVLTRRSLQQKFTENHDASPVIMATNALDKEFLLKATRIVEENLQNADFDIANFAQELALGRTSLFEKMKGVTSMSPNKFISTIRLRKALHMLDTEPSLSISDIAYTTGFNSPNYFIRSFKATYGITPAAYRNTRTLPNGQA